MCLKELIGIKKLLIIEDSDSYKNEIFRKIFEKINFLDPFIKFKTI